MRTLYLAVATAAICAASAASATIYTLKFDASNACGPMVCANTDAISQSYGDVPGLDISYRSMATTGNGVVFLNDMYYWDFEYGDLTDVTWAQGTEINIMEITFTVTQPGLTFTLLDFDTAGWPNTDRDTQVRLYQLDYSLIDSFAFVAPGQGHTSITCGGCATTAGFVLQLGPDGYNVGIDNLRFELTGRAVPEPASWALMIAGFGMVGGALRRRHALPARG